MGNVALVHHQRPWSFLPGEPDECTWNGHSLRGATLRSMAFWLAQEQIQGIGAAQASEGVARLKSGRYD